MVARTGGSQRAEPPPGVRGSAAIQAHPKASTRISFSDFQDPAADDYHLEPDSPCKGAGDESLLPVDEFDLDGDSDLTEPLSQDLDGEARVQGTGLDMGCYEQ